MNVQLYSNGCPRCNVLEQKLNQKEVSYTVVHDVEIMKSKGFYQVPMLEVDGKVMDFKNANDWINNLP